jgi:hypothetical protein
VSHISTVRDSNERVFDEQTVDFLTVLQIFAVQHAALTLESSGDNETVIPGKPVFPRYPQGIDIKSSRGMNGQ